MGKPNNSTGRYNLVFNKFVMSSCALITAETTLLRVWMLYSLNMRQIFDCLLVCLIVFNATFNNISAISGRSVLLAEETGGPGENHPPSH
jgi:hypothetical protein